MEARLVHAATRLDTRVGPENAPGAVQLRSEQARVFADFATYLTDIATRPACGPVRPFCRIIQPPRTGKTVVAGHIIDRAGLTATFIVPTRTLVEQTVRELRRQLPGVKIGSYYGEVKRVVEHGVNVVTYAMLQKSGRHGELPQPICTAGLVLVDEAHHAMTPARTALLQQAFDPLAIRIALTATPDFDEERALCRFFPDLVHEITLEEALELELLAPLRVWVAEVDADASSVRFISDDYDFETLGRLMSTAPFFRAVEVFRYDPDNQDRACLIACASRQQAYDLYQYLCQHRPAGRPAPRLILGDTAPDKRRSRLEQFERGEIDTLIQVGVLIEGWNAPRCKLLLDLAPSASRVRATQKYFRVMTRHAGAEARIFVLLPRDLPSLPVVPMELFGRSLTEYECGQVIGGGDDPGAGVAPIQRLAGTPVEGVHLRKRIVLTARLEKPALDPGRRDDVRAVIASCPDFDPAVPCGLHRFRGLLFQHPLFFGRGEFLLRWLGVSARRDQYHALLDRLYPEHAADRMLAQEQEAYRDAWCAADREHFEQALVGEPTSEACGPEEPFASTWRALTGVIETSPESAEDLLIQREREAVVGDLVEQLPVRKRRMVIARFGLFGQPEGTLEQVGALEDISRERVRSIVSLALRRLYKLMLRPEYREVFGLLTRQEQRERAQEDAAQRLVERPEAAAGAAPEADEAPFVDVDGYYRPEAWEVPCVRERIRRVRRVAFLRMVRHGVLHIDYGAQVTPCGRAVADRRAVVIEPAQLYGGQLPRARLCGACLTNRRTEVAAEMALLEAQLGVRARGRAERA